MLRKLLNIVLVLAVGGGAFCLLERIPHSEDGAEVREAPPVNVTVQVITPERQLPDAFNLPAVVEANRVVTVSAEVEGRIERISCTEGKPCQAGDPMVSLNADLLRADFERASAQAKYDEQEYKRMLSLTKGGAATEKQRDEAEYRMAVSRADMTAARTRLKRTEVLAPTSGILNELLVEEGEYLQSGTAVAEIVDMATVKVIVQVPERDIPRFKRGGKAEVFAASPDGIEVCIVGEITYVSELADERTRSTKMEVTLDNRKRLLRSGQIVRVRLTRRMLTDVVMIPLRSVIPHESGKDVYVVEDGKAQSRKVILGLIRGDKVRVVSGLKAGDRLITSGHRYVGPGQKVKVIEEKKI